LGSTERSWSPVSLPDKFSDIDTQTRGMYIVIMTGILQNTSKRSEKIIKVEEFFTRTRKIVFFKTALRDEQQGVFHDPNIGSNEIKCVDNDFWYYT
jgi:hypothetical protein